MKEGDSDLVVITVTIAKADVVNIIAPVAAAAITTNEDGPAGEDAIKGGEKPAYAAGEEPDEVVFEEVE